MASSLAEGLGRPVNLSTLGELLQNELLMGWSLLPSRQKAHPAIEHEQE